MNDIGAEFGPAFGGGKPLQFTFLERLKSKVLFNVMSFMFEVVLPFKIDRVRTAMQILVDRLNNLRLSMFTCDAVSLPS